MSRSRPIRGCRMTGSASQAMDVVFRLSEAFQRRGPERRYMSRSRPAGPWRIASKSYIYNRASRFGPKLELATLRDGVASLIFGGPIFVAVAVATWKLSGAVRGFWGPFWAIYPSLKAVSVYL